MINDVVFVLPGPPDNSHCGGVTQVQRISAELNARGMKSEVSWSGQKYDGKYIIATAWQTAWEVSKAVRLHPFRIGHYVQNWEDNLAFCGNQSMYANEAMEMINEKMVVSRDMLERWPDATWVPAIVGPAHYQRIPKLYVNRDLMIHVRGGEAKGMLWGLEVAKDNRLYGKISVDLIGQATGVDLSDEKIAQKLNRTCCMFVPSRLEGATTWVPEALVNGCRVVATKACGWVKESPPDTVFVDYGNTEAAIKGILDSIHSRNSVEARTWAKQWTVKRATDAFVGWMEKNPC